MRNTWTLLAIVSFCVLALAAIRVGAQSVQPTSPTYSWSGELVGLDTDGRTITVKSRVVGEQALADLPRFKAGDRIVLTWSGFDTYADAISRAVRYEAAKKWTSPLRSRRVRRVEAPRSTSRSNSRCLPPASQPSKLSRPGGFTATSGIGRPAIGGDHGGERVTASSARCTTN